LKTKTEVQFSLGDIHIPVVFEHDDFWIVLKPAELACHGPDPVNLAAILQQAGHTPFLAHRLDKSSSGLMIIARHKQAAENFRVLFEQHEIEKFYLAVSEHKGKKKQGAIKGFMKKSRHGNWILSKEADKVDDKQAITQFFSFSSEQHQRVFIVKISTGFSHQIRVALKANSSPIVGDKRYGGLPAKRMLLHAYALRFTYANTVYEFQDWPEDKLFPRMDMLGNPKNLPLGKPWLMAWPKV
jgi:tRNA pseudouridine32 synthase / 23S rRNA pseudouridine746 synthase